jgi:transposase
MAREAIAKLYDLFRDLDLRIASFDKKIERVFRNSEACQRIAKPRSSPPSATARSSRADGISPLGSAPAFQR